MASVSGNIDLFLKAQDSASRLKFQSLGNTAEIVASGTTDNTLHNHGIGFLDETRFVVGYRTYDSVDGGARPFLRAGEITSSGINLGDAVKVFSSGINQSVPVATIDANNGVVVFETASGVHLRKFSVDNLDITLLGDSQHDIIDPVIPPRIPDLIYTDNDTSGNAHFILSFNQHNDSGNPGNNNVRLAMNLIRANSDHTFSNLFSFNMSNDTNGGNSYGSMDVLTGGMSGTFVISESRTPRDDVRARVLRYNLISQTISPVTTTTQIEPVDLPFNTTQRNTNLCRKIDDDKFMCFYANYNLDNGEQGPIMRVCSYAGTVITPSNKHLWYQLGNPSLSAAIVDSSGLIIHRGQEDNPESHLKFINIDGLNVEFYETTETNLDLSNNSEYVAISNNGFNYLIGGADVSSGGKITIQHLELGDILNISKSLNFSVTASDTINNRINLFLANTIINNNISCFIHGIDNETDSINIFLAGHLTSNDNINLFTDGKDIINDSADLIVVYPSFHQGFLNLFIHGYLDVSGNIDISINGHGLSNDNINHYIQGYILENDSINLFTMAGISFNNLSFFIQGTSEEDDDSFGVTFDELLKRGDYNPQIIGRFTNTVPSSVNIQIWNTMDSVNEPIVLSSSGCYEIGNTGRWGWSTSNLPPLNRVINQFVYTMISNTGEEFIGDFVIKTKIDDPIKHPENEEHIRRI